MLHSTPVAGKGLRWKRKIIAGAVVNHGKHILAFSSNDEGKDNYGDKYRDKKSDGED